MDFLGLVRARYSCRSYKSDPVSDEALGRVLEAMRLAPTACNRQPFRAYVLRTADYREPLRHCYSRDWILSAPLTIVMVAQLDRAWTHRDGTNYGIVDATIAFDHLILAAAAEGLATCWIAAFDSKQMRNLLKLPETAVPVAMTPLGHAADSAPIKERQPLETLVRYGAP